VHGPWDPELGHRFNPNKLLLDPYARGLVGGFTWHPAVFGYDTSDAREDLSFSSLDSAAYVPKCRVTASTYDWEGDELPNVPWADTLIYEAYVKGMTMLHPDLAPNLRGTYLGLVSEPILEHLLDLGVSAIELLPVCHSLTERHLAARLNAQGQPVKEEELDDPELRTFGWLLSSSQASESNEAVDEPHLLLVSAGHESAEFSLPTLQPGGQWHLVLNTAHPGKSPPVSGQRELAPRSLILLRYGA
jgi:isoamylase